MKDCVLCEEFNLKEVNFHFCVDTLSISYNISDPNIKMYVLYKFLKDSYMGHRDPDGEKNNNWHIFSSFISNYQLSSSSSWIKSTGFAFFRCLPNMWFNSKMSFSAFSEAFWTNQGFAEKINQAMSKTNPCCFQITPTFYW